MSNKQGLMTNGVDRFDIASAHAAFCDWMNYNGTTLRDRDPTRKSGKTASCQLHNISYSPGWGDYFEKDSVAAEVYCELVRRYEPQGYAEAVAEWLPGGGE